MKAFLLAAGLGTRLRPLTENTPKCLLPIRGRPLLSIWLELCVRAGIDSILINLHAHTHSVRDFLQGCDVPIHIEIAEEPLLLGSAGTLAANRSWVKCDREFFVLYGDVLTNVDLRTLYRYHQKSGKTATLALNRVPDPSRCGVVTLDATGTVTEFQEKPETPPSNLVFSGIMLANSELLDFLPDHVPADLGYDVLPQLPGRMAGFEITDYLSDIGTIHTYLDAQQTWPGLPPRD